VFVSASFIFFNIEKHSLFIMIFYSIPLVIFGILFHLMYKDYRKFENMNDSFLDFERQEISNRNEK